MNLHDVSFARFFSILFLFLVFTSQSSKGADERGKALYGLCASCHGVAGLGNKEVSAPSIAGLPNWYVANQLKKFRDGLRGKHVKDSAGLHMRPMARNLKNDEDVRVVSEYVASLNRHKASQTFSGDLQNGQAKFAVCVACHGADANGNQALNAPPLKGANDWYLLTQLKHFKEGIRGNPSVDPAGSVMAPMAKMLEDEKAMKDVISYIQSLP